MSNRTLLFLLAATTLVGFGCHRQSELRKQLIAGKYWDVYFNNPAEPGPYCYKILNDGTCTYYSYENWGGKNKQHVHRIKFQMGDVVAPETWTLKGDTMLTLLGYLNRRILRVTPDTLFLQNPVTLEREKLVRSPIPGK